MLCKSNQLNFYNGARLIFERLAATIAGSEDDDSGGFDLALVETKAGKIEAESIAGRDYLKLAIWQRQDLDGYDLSDVGLQRAADLGASLIVTADCGTVALEPLARARERGVDVVVGEQRLGRRVQGDAVVLHLLE